MNPTIASAIEIVVGRAPIAPSTYKKAARVPVKNDVVAKARSVVVNPLNAPNDTMNMATKISCQNHPPVTVDAYTIHSAGVVKFANGNAI